MHCPGAAGTVVDVSLIDMNGMGGMMRGGQSSWRTWHAGMMRVISSTQNATAGTVSLRVTNQGVITHELVVLPLAAGQRVGNRAVGQDGKVDETGSLGEVSKSYAAGAGDGLSPGSSGWSTLTLPSGRYELICNLPGHYRAGMYARLDAPPRSHGGKQGRRGTSQIMRAPIVIGEPLPALRSL